jgi:hypothetical protein
MSKIIKQFILDFLEGAFQYMTDKSLGHIVSLALNVEEYIKNLGVNGLDDLFKIFVSFGISMIIVKFLKKGFEMYVLWTDGDADADPLLLVSNFVRAMVVALTFTFLYEILAEIVIEMSDQALNTIGLNMVELDFSRLLDSLIDMTLFYIIGFLVFTIIYIFLYIKFIKNGFEILILRIGAPLACIGLMDADKGVFKTYIQKFFQATLTVLVQVLLTKLGLALIISGNLVWGIAAGYFAIKTPKFLQEFLIFSGGGGITNNIYSTARLAQMFRSIVK